MIRHTVECRAATLVVRQDAGWKQVLSVNRTENLQCYCRRNRAGCAKDLGEWKRFQTFISFGKEDVACLLGSFKEFFWSGGSKAWDGSRRGSRHTL